MEIAIGTSGFQYPEWKGRFYPEDLSAAKMLGYYAARFNSTESNYTFRRLPSVKALTRWRDGTPPTFTFSCKASQRITHSAKLRDCAQMVRTFLEPLQTLEGKLGAVLFQLPPTFKADIALLQDFLASAPSELRRAAFEFRHTSWFADATYEVLQQAGAALCVAEDEELATPAEATAGFGYLRLRRTDYKPAQLKKWAQWIDSQRVRWDRVYIYTRHEEQAVGPRFAQTLQKLLKAGEKSH